MLLALEQNWALLALDLLRRGDGLLETDNPTILQVIVVAECDDSHEAKQYERHAGCDEQLVTETERIGNCQDDETGAEERVERALDQLAVCQLLLGRVGGQTSPLM